jgi:hypothetical protein
VVVYKKENIMDEQAMTGMPENFMFAIIVANPTTDSVKVTIDDGSIRFIMKRDKFAGLIEKLCSIKMKILVEMAMKEYGETYLLDRSQEKLIHLTPKQIKEIDFKKIREDTIKRENENNTSNITLFNFDPALKKQHESLINRIRPKGRIK